MISRLFGQRIVEQVPALQRYARALARDNAAADDLVQEALTLACDKHRTFRSDGNLRAWLLSIVHNSFVSAKRREASEQRRMEGAAVLAPAHVEAAQLPALRLEAVAQAFAALADEQRAVLHLVAVEGLSYAEAAAALDTPVGTVMSRLSRARAALRDNEAMPRSAGAAALRVVGGRDGG